MCAAKNTLNKQKLREVGPLQLISPTAGPFTSVHRERFLGRESPEPEKERQVGEVGVLSGGKEEGRGGQGEVSRGEGGVGEGENFQNDIGTMMAHEVGPSLCLPNDSVKGFEERVEGNDDEKHATAKNQCRFIQDPVV